MNLKSDNRVACLVRENDPFCGDGIVQVNSGLEFQTSIKEILKVRLHSSYCINFHKSQEGEECDCGSIFQCIATRSSCIPPEGKGKREKACKEDPNGKYKNKNP